MNELSEQFNRPRIVEKNCSICGKLRLVPGREYSIGPDAVCKCKPIHPADLATLERCGQPPERIGVSRSGSAMLDDFLERVRSHCVSGTTRDLSISKEYQGHGIVRLQLTAYDASHNQLEHVDVSLLTDSISSVLQ